MATIVIGDVHGCLEELDELLGLADPRRQHRLVFLGDLVDRGPDPVGVVRRVRELGAECVQGNHDEKHVRWARHEARRHADPSYRNPMRPLSPEQQAQNVALGEAGISFLAGLPLRLDLGRSWWAVHGGAAPSRLLAEQKAAALLRCRWVDVKGRMIGKAERPDGAVHWASKWQGRESIVYGHHVHDRSDPKRDHGANSACIGIDTGCCFGGRLTAYVLEADEIVQVSARAEYARLLEGELEDA